MPPKKATEKEKKSSPKRNKGKTNSPKKQSPNKKKKSPPAGEDLVKHLAVQTENSTMCLICNAILKSTISVQSHIVAIDHELFSETGFVKCRVCSIKLNIFQSEKHFCVINKENFLDQVLGSTLKYGPPTVCLLCRGRNFSSKGELIAHLICVHSPRKKPNICAMCEFPHGEVDIPEDDDNLPAYNQEWDKHVLKFHSPGISLISKRNVSNNSELRFPYSCPFCGFMMPDNATLHAHIICRHTSSYFYEIELFVCVICDKPYFTNDSLNDHIHYNHVKSFIILGKHLQKDGRINNHLNYSHTCTMCWSNFDYDFYLQAHLLVHHSRIGTYTCGICKRDFSTYGSIKNIWKNFLRHEKLHMNEFHKAAIEFKVTSDDVIEIPPDSDDEPSLEVGLKDKSKKGSPKHKKTSPKVKKKSPDKSLKKEKKEKKEKKKNKQSTGKEIM